MWWCGVVDWLADHPREYGENGVGAVQALRSQGSSPRIRGEFLPNTRGFRQRGIIPANTGRIGVMKRRRSSHGDHPREYGENHHPCVTRRAYFGSSPRIRGELEPADSCVHGIGIIPANTGRILGSIAASAAARDHPREYGENAGLGIAGLADEGSSPRIRGE